METFLAVLSLIATLWYFWDKIIAWWQERKSKGFREPINLAANPTRENTERVIMESDPVKDWDHVYEGNRTITTYKKDMNLRFEINYSGTGIQCNNFQEPWANRHPDPAATGYWCSLYYGATLVEKFILVSVDGGRAMLPIPQRDTRGPRHYVKVLPFDYKIAQIHDRGFVKTLDEYMKRSGLTIDTDQKVK